MSEKLLRPREACERLGVCRDMRELARIIKAQGLSLDRLPDEVRSKILIQTLIEG